MKTNLGLVEYCQKQLGNPYWWDTYGQIADESLYLEKKKQYPEHYGADDFATQYGKRVFDCAGLIKGYLWSTTPESTPKYNLMEDLTSNQFLEVCENIDDIKNIIEVPGILLFFPGHIGVYVKNGKAIEARGHAYGVVETAVKDRPWKMWGRLKWIKYI